VRRALWVGGIALANAAAAGLVATQIVRTAAGEGWAMLVPCASVATFSLTLGGLWWGAPRRPRIRTAMAIGLAVGVLAHPLMWYLVMLVAYLTGARGSLGEPVLTPVEALAAMWFYAALSLVLTGWLSCPISAAVCGLGLAAYTRRGSSGARE
jgi:hypothetical protein